MMEDRPADENETSTDYSLSLRPCWYTELSFEQNELIKKHNSPFNTQNDFSDNSTDWFNNYNVMLSKEHIWW